MIDFYDVPCFVISRPQDEARRAITQQRLDEQGLSFEWFDAVDGHSLPIEEFVKEGIEMKCRGSCGCALSHKRLWKKIVDEDIDRAIVFEDDVIFHEKFRELMPFFWEQTPKDDVMVFLGYCCYWGHMGERYVMEGVPLTTHAYYITKSVARWLLESFGNCRQHIDIHLQYLYDHPPRKRTWKSYIWWEGVHRSPLNNQTRLNVCFNGLVFQDHDLENSITPGLGNKSKK
jgi:GR25 family glycosyltransferase involved in LPS biosynthesis